jgi:hypothetical protein
MKTLKELQPLIIEWASNKGLIKEENAPKQRLKLIEECGELASGILKNKVEDQKDAIGDIFVVLVILAEQLKSDLDLELRLKNNNIILFYINLILKYSFVDTYFIRFSIEYLNCLSIELNHDLTECANLAWNEIKNRTGQTVNGTFIKD